MILRSIH